MKFNLTFTVFCIVIFTCVSTFAVVPTDWNIEGLRGKVKSIDEDTTELKLKDGVQKESSRNRTRTIKFDDSGRMTYEWQKIGNLSPFENFYTYEKDKRYTRGVRSNLPVSNRIYETLSYRIIKFKADEDALYQDEFIERRQLGDTKTKSFKYVFLTDGRIIEETMYSGEGDPIFLTKYFYVDEQKLPTEKQIGNPFNVKQTQIFTYKYEVDEQGNWTKRTAEITGGGKAQPTEINYRKIKYYN